jgi:hypothetical protein
LGSGFGWIVITASGISMRVWLTPMTFTTATLRGSSPSRQTRISWVKPVVMVAFRPQDQMDIDTLLTANRDKIDVQLRRVFRRE